MKFWVSAEIFHPALKVVFSLQKEVEVKINRILDQSSLAQLEGEFHYIPIIMPDKMLDFYPSRSGIKKNGVYECSPQLNYDVFVKGSPPKYGEEYFRGIEESAENIRELGASRGQILEFRDIVKNVKDEIIADFVSDSKLS